MDVAFVTPSLRALCERHRKAKLGLGEEVAANLKQRLADIEGAESAEDLGTICPVVRSTDGQMMISLSNQVNLVMRANHRVLPVLDNGEIAWADITRVKIVAVAKHA